MHIGVQFTLVTLFLTKIDVAFCSTNLTRLFLPGDTTPFNFTQVALENGHTVETYEVVTSDGYILEMFRIPGFRDKNLPQRGLPVLLMHGILDSADVWIYRGKDSLAITLANAGYDVWCGNTRGSKYSRRHVHLNPDRDPAYWDFSFDDHGMYDLPSLIDLVLQKTGAKKLNAVGYSQGNAIFYVMGSLRPEYNEKVNVMMALAPICYLSHVHKPLATLIKLSPVLYKKTKLIGQYVFPGRILGRNARRFCSKPIIGYAKCLLDTLFPLVGYDAEELEPDFFSTLVGHIYWSTSTKNLYHFGQVGRNKRFARFDYGPARNLEEYGSEDPPEYDLSRVTMPVVLLVGANDYISVIADVELLRMQLPNVIEYTVLQRKLTNHLDFVVGRHMKDYLFPDVLRILNRFM